MSSRYLKAPFLFVALHCFFCIYCRGQWNARIANPQADFFTIDIFLDSLFKTLPLDTSEGSDAMQYARWRFFWQNRMGSGIEQKKSGSFRHAYDALFSLMQNPVCDVPSSIPANWSLIGPITLSQQKIGRVDALARDPNNTSVVYVGTPSGGVNRQPKVER